MILMARAFGDHITNYEVADSCGIQVIGNKLDSKTEIVWACDESEEEQQVADQYEGQENC